MPSPTDPTPDSPHDSDGTTPETDTNTSIKHLTIKHGKIWVVAAVLAGAATITIGNVTIPLANVTVQQFTPTFLVTTTIISLLNIKHEYNGTTTTSD